MGVVVGWGKDEHGKVSQTLMKASMPVVKTTTCLYSNPEFYGRYTSEMSFCAGYRNGTSVCNGDSGGGLVFQRPGAKVWQLRGIVSLSVAQQGLSQCDSYHYVVFTDVSKYMYWIEPLLGRSV